LSQNSIFQPRFLFSLQVQLMRFRRELQRAFMLLEITEHHHHKMALFYLVD
jgi:hypothetical protein